MSKVMIIAEAGVNHNGDMAIAKKLVDAAAVAGVDYVKFQTFKAAKLVSAEAPKAAYQDQNTGDDKSTQYEMLKQLELSEEDHVELIAYCAEKKIQFLSTAFDMDSLELLRSFGLKLFKIPSGELTNLPYVVRLAQIAEEIILSTGMSTMEEIRETIGVIRQENRLCGITVLHCNTDYPTPFADVNLLAMPTMKNELGTEIGYSDHTLGIEVPIAAVALGATVIEKHFTLDKNMKGPDHAASIDPEELIAMVAAIRNIEMALGSTEKIVTASESRNIHIARKSIHLAMPLVKGTVIQPDHLEMLRPGDGISPMKLKEVVGKALSKDLPKGHKIMHTDFE